MKILWKGCVFHPTGMATAARELLKALEKKGCKIQVTDPWKSKYPNLQHWNNAIDVEDGVTTIFFDYPQFWREAYGDVIGGFVHEGTRLFPQWVDIMSKVKKIWCPSESVKKMFKWNGVQSDIAVVPHGVDAELYKPLENKTSEGSFVFLSVNSWTGEPNDRKGTDLLIKAFDEEFKGEDVKLLLKISTFFDQKPLGYYQGVIRDLLGYFNENILINEKYEEENKLVEFYQKSDCFVAPTRGEGFGLTLINSLACGCPVITTKDNNSGHMDFCKDNPAVLWIKSNGNVAAPESYYAQGNYLANPDIDELKKQMRWAYENRDKLIDMGIKGSNEAKKWTWDKAADKMIQFISKKEEKKIDGTEW